MYATSTRSQLISSSASFSPSPPSDSRRPPTTSPSCHTRTIPSPHLGTCADHRTCSKEKSTFLPVHPFNLEEPKTWASTAGTMDWDTTHICFTKRSLLDFLKQAGVSVGTNYTEIAKLPSTPSFCLFFFFGEELTVDCRVCDVWQVFAGGDERGRQGSRRRHASFLFSPLPKLISSPFPVYFFPPTAEIADPTTTSSAPHTTRKVTQPPGGASNITISGGELVEEDALSLAPPKESTSSGQGEEEGEGVTYTHTEKAEVRSVSVDMDGEERYGFSLPFFLFSLALSPHPFSSLLHSRSRHLADLCAYSRPAGSVPGFRPTRKVREGKSGPSFHETRYPQLTSASAAPGGKSDMGNLLFGGYNGN